MTAPSTGLTGLLDFLPGGAAIKGKILLKLKPTLGLLGHPNILADRALLPELIEEVDPTPLAELSIRLLKEKKQLRRVAEHLTNLYPWTQNPAHSVVKKLAEGLG